MNIKQEILMSLITQNIFSMSENRTTRSPKNSKIKHFIIVSSCFDNNFYYATI